MKLLPKIILFAFLACATRGLASTETPVPKTSYGSWDSITASPVPKGSTITVVGWGADTAAIPTATSGVVARVFVDGVFMIEVPMSDSRPDVVAYYGFKNSGFTATFSSATLTPGDHAIDIRVGGGPSGWNHYTKPVSSGGTVTVTDPKRSSSAKQSTPTAMPATAG